MDNHFNPSFMSYPHPQQTQQSPASLGSFGNISASAQSGQSSQHQHQQPPQQQQQQQQQSQQQDSPVHPTLPPLQNQNTGFAHFGSLSYAHPSAHPSTPTTPHTPASSSIANPSANAFSHVSHGTSMGPPNTYGNAYAISQPMMFPSSTATSMPPTPAAAGGLPTIRPMPPGGASSALGSNLPSLVGGQLGQQPSFMQNEDAPTHVVGSQGRRGILPSAPGRPNAAAPGNGQAAKTMVPQKDADGKFPCPHCNKTYLHAKHLKRHMLRHTGDRPYSCHLCKDTFSRSDILKRHFQKCSIRRGNPTGASHLAHQRRGNNSNNRLSLTQQDGPIGLAGLQEVSGAGTYNPANMVDHSPTVNGDASTRTSRANSLIAPGGMSHRNSIAGLGILGSNAPGASEQMPTSQPGFNPNLHAYGMSNGANGTPQMQSNYAAFSNQPQMNGNFFNPASTNQQPMSFLGHPSSRFNHSHTNSPHQQSPTADGHVNHLDSGRIFAPNGQDGFIGAGLGGNASSQAGNENIKTDHDAKHYGGDMTNDLTAGGQMGMVWS